MRLLELAINRPPSFSAVDRVATSPLGLGLMAPSPAAVSGPALDIPETRATSATTAGRGATPAAEPRPSAHADALRLAVHLRAATGNATGQTLLLCGLLPGQSVRRLTYETAIAFEQLQHVPVLVVDLEPIAEDHDADPHGLLPETDAAAWLDPGKDRRPMAAVLRVFRRRTPGSYLASAAFGQDLAAWRAVAGVVICCAEPLPDTVDTLAAATQCTGTVLVVPSRGATVEPAVSVRDTFARAGVTLLGCVFDTTPMARGRKVRRRARR